MLLKKPASGERQRSIYIFSRTLLPAFLFLALQAAGQQEKTAAQAAGQIEGIVFDKDTKERVARTLITNITSRQLWFDNLKGEFKITGRPGEKVVFSRDGYQPDTVVIKNDSNLIVYLQSLGIRLPEVTVRDSLHTPMQKLAATQREFSRIYRPSANITSPFTSLAGSGAGLSLDALYNSLSRSGRNGARLQGLIQTDYEQNVIDFRFNKSYVAAITKLKEPDLSDFMLRYRPTYFRVSTDTEYEFITYIRASLKRYLRNKRAFGLPPLAGSVR